MRPVGPSTCHEMAPPSDNILHLIMSPHPVIVCLLHNYVEHLDRLAGGERITRPDSIEANSGRAAY